MHAYAAVGLATSSNASCTRAQDKRLALDPRSTLERHRGASSYAIRDSILQPLRRSFFDPSKDFRTPTIPIDYPNLVPQKKVLVQVTG